jgi:prepilin-type N-terminal cleavage/methylation domain-containing protein
MQSGRRSFTLIELLVTIGLMAILALMLWMVFYQAAQSFRSARATIEIHEGARAAFNALLDDLTAAEFCSYDNGVQGYFALSQGPTTPATGNCQWRGPWSNTATYAVNDVVSNAGSFYLCIAAPPVGQAPPSAAYWSNYIVPLASDGRTVVPADTLTFTTLAPQPSARYAAPEAVQQLALVRYALEWDGGSATLSHSAPRPTFNLVKRVRFPNGTGNALNMDDFYVNDLQNEVNSTDLNWMQYAESEPIAFHVLSMNVRLFCLPAKTAGEIGPPGDEAFVEAGGPGNPPPGNPSGADPASLTDTTKNWPSGSFAGDNLRIYAGTAAGQWSTINPNTTANTVYLNACPLPNPPNLLPGTLNGQNWTPLPPDPTSQYRIDGTLINLAPLWSATATYNMGALVSYSVAGVITDYVSLQSSNTNQTPNTSPTYWAVASPPNWYQRSSYGTNFFGPTYRPPAIVEITLEMTDMRATNSFTFTQRFYIPASER